MGRARRRKARRRCASAFAAYSLGDSFPSRAKRSQNAKRSPTSQKYSDFIDVQPEGYGIDKIHPEVVLTIPKWRFGVRLHHRHIRWKDAAGRDPVDSVVAGSKSTSPEVGYKLQLANIRQALRVGD